MNALANLLGKALPPQTKKHLAMTLKATHPKVTGHMLVWLRDDGMFERIENHFPEALNATRRERLREQLPIHVTDIARLEQDGWVLEPLTENAEPAPGTQGAAGRLALFCLLYKKHLNVSYKATGADAGKLKTHVISEPEMEAYFACTEWFAKTKSVAGLVRHLNEVRAWMQKAATNRHGHPDAWDAAYASRLDGPSLSAYQQHLRALGLKPKKGVRGDVIGWESRTLPQAQ